jgi:Protein of unknown function (DUF1579)
MTSFIVALSLIALLSAVALVHGKMQTHKPGPELKKLDYFAGTWNWDAEMKAGPLGPGGKVTLTERYKWMDGGFFLISHTDFKTPMGDGTGLSLYGYDRETKVYTYDEYNSMGEAIHSKGTLEGDTWTYTCDQNMEGQAFKGRFTMKMLSATAYTIKFEISPNGASWTTVMEGRATKTK